MTAAVERYLEHLRTKCRRTTVETADYRLKAILQLETTGNRAIRSLTPARGAELYQARTIALRADGQPVQAGTHHGELKAARAFGTWCVKQGWLRANPFADVELAGRASAGKPQLRVDEARRFIAQALGEGTAAGLACTLPLLMGMRATEVTERAVRDVDNQGRLLWIDAAKTRAGVRHLEVPEMIVPPLVKLARDREPTEQLFGDGVDRQWLYYHTDRIASEAKLPHTSPHALRGLWSTLSISTGTPVDQVARALGHADRGVTARRHYIAPGTERAAGARAALGVLAGGVDLDRDDPGDEP